MLRKVAIAACAILSFANLAFGQSEVENFESGWGSGFEERITYDDIYYHLGQEPQIEECEDWEEGFSKIWEWYTHCLSCTSCEQKLDIVYKDDYQYIYDAIVYLLQNPQCLPGCELLEDSEESEIYSLTRLCF